MKAKSNNYFELLKNQLSSAVQATNFLQDVLTKFNPKQINTYRKQMQNIILMASNAYNDILSKLLTEFITPINQEDILHLAQLINNITTALNNVILDIYMYHITKITYKTTTLSNIVAKCIYSLYSAVTELENFKKPQILREKLVIVSNFASKATEIYIDAIYNLFSTCTDVKTLLGEKAVYVSLANCCTICARTTNIIEQIIIKNT